MRQCLAGRPGLYGKALLAAMCVAAPVLLAQDNAPQSAFPAYVPTMTFDVAAVRQTKPDATLGFTVWRISAAQFEQLRASKQQHREPDRLGLSRRGPQGGRLSEFADRSAVSDVRYKREG